MDRRTLDRRKWNAQTMYTHLRVSFALIFFLRLSFVTKSPVSSLRAYRVGGSRIFRLIHNCRTTSSTVSVGSIRARTVTPSFVFTVLVGTRATDFGRLVTGVVGA
jgi:hypothetical protein